MNKTKNIIALSYFLSFIIGMHQLTALCADNNREKTGYTAIKTESAQKPESTEEINEKTFSAVTKNENKSVNDYNVSQLRQKLIQNSEKTRNFDSKTLNLTAEFNAFPQKSTINLTLKNMDVASILRMIAKEANKNIVLDESVKGTISAELKNISLNEAMQIILTSQELEARTEGNTIFVASRPAMARKGLNRKYIKAFKLNNSNAVDIAKILDASIFNKGYKINEKETQASATPTQAMQPVANQTSNTNAQTQPEIQASVSQGTSTGQSSIAGSKKITGKVEILQTGANFGDAGELASKIKIQYNSASTKDIEINNNDGGAIVIPDTRTNSVLVAGLKEDLVLAEQAISYLDKPLSQVSIEVSLIELTKEDSDNLGLSGSGNAGKFSGGFNAISGTSQAASIATDVDSTAIGYNSVKSIADQISLKLNALIKTHKAKLLANPTVLALDGSESLIKITDQIVSRMTVTSVPNGPTTSSPELSDIGIVLNILPKIGTDGSITMRIRPSITTFLKEVTFGTSGYANLISTREVIIQDARVKAGETLAIAGLIKDSEIQSIGKIPYAADLPVFGNLFKNKIFDRKKTELVILITPKLISDVATN